MDQRAWPRESPCDIGAFEAEGGGSEADCNADGDVNPQDLLAFLNTWNGRLLTD